MKRFLLAAIISLAAAGTGALAQSAKPPERSPAWQWPEHERARSGFDNAMLGHLHKYVGTYDYEAIVSDPAVKPHLDRLMGTALTLLLERMETRAGISYQFTCLCLILYGTQRNVGDKENMILMVPIRSLNFWAGLTVSGRKTVYTISNFTTFFPSQIEHWLFPYQISDTIDRSRATIPFGFINRSAQ